MRPADSFWAANGEIDKRTSGIFTEKVAGYNCFLVWSGMRQSDATGAEIPVPADTAWLLQCLIHCTRKSSGAALHDIIAFGDYINHAVFEHTEFCSALTFLIAARIAFVRRGRIFLTKNFRALLPSMATQQKRPAYPKEYVQIKSFLLCLPPVKISLRRPITKKIFLRAVQGYLKPDKK